MEKIGKMENGTWKMEKVAMVPFLIQRSVFRARFFRFPSKKGALIAPLLTSRMSDADCMNTLKQ